MTLDVARGAPKPPPEKPEAEASLLGSVLIDARPLPSITSRSSTLWGTSVSRSIPKA